MKTTYLKPYGLTLFLSLLFCTVSCSKDDATEAPVDTIESLLENAPENNTTPEDNATPEETNTSEESTPSETPNTTETNNESTTNSELNSVAQEILELVNAHRRSKGKQPLAISPLANTLAQSHTEYMVRVNAISHDNFDARSDRLFKEDNARGTGENVASGQRSAAAVMEAWLDSTGHRKNIEGDFTHIGISVVNNASGRPFYTQLFLKK